MELEMITFTARETSQYGEDNETLTTYTFRGYKLPTGEVCVRNDNAADCWFQDVDAVQANGTDAIDSWKVGQTTYWSDDRIAESVSGSAKEFGRSAIPETLQYLMGGA